MFVLPEKGDSPLGAPLGTRHSREDIGGRRIIAFDTLISKRCLAVVVIRRNPDIRVPIDAEEVELAWPRNQHVSPLRFPFPLENRLGSSDGIFAALPAILMYMTAFVVAPPPIGPQETCNASSMTVKSGE